VGQRYWAIAIKRTVLALIIVALAGVGFDYLTNSPEDRSPLTAAAVALGIYLVVNLILGVLNALSGALYLWLFADADLTGAMLDQLRMAKLPPPERYQPKTNEYLAMLVDDGRADPNDRVKAAIIFSEFNAAKRSSIFRGLALMKAMDTAVLRYAQEAPERSSANA
jgi:hypothetical protein